jgi:hypothetical protein
MAINIAVTISSKEPLLSFDTPSINEFCSIIKHTRN